MRGRKNFFQEIFLPRNKIKKIILHLILTYINSIQFSYLSKSEADEEGEDITKYDSRSDGSREYYSREDTYESAGDRYNGGNDYHELEGPCYSHRGESGEDNESRDKK